MSDITGTVIKLRDFLFDVDTQITIKYNGKKHPVLTFEKGRVLTIPDYQREIRWKKETLFSLMNDISHGNKFIRMNTHFLRILVNMAHISSTLFLFPEI